MSNSTVRKAYWVCGVVIGALWAWNGGEPLWEHALRLLVLLFVGAPLALHVVRRKVPADRPLPSFARLASAKLALLAVSLIASWALRGEVGHPDLVVAAGLALCVGLLGPVLHPHLLRDGSP